MEGKAPSPPEGKPNSISNRRANALIISAGLCLFLLGLIFGNLILPRGAVSSVLPFLPGPASPTLGSNPSSPSPPPTASKPVVVFGSPTSVNSTSWRIQVAAASVSLAPSDYRVSFTIAGMEGNVTAFPATDGATATLTIGSATVGIGWSDGGGDGKLGAGDTITVTVMPAPGSGVSMTFNLLYSDGTQIATTAWSS